MEEKKSEEGPKTTSLDRNELAKALELAEKDSIEIAQSFNSLFDSLRLSLSQATSTSVDHMNCFSEAAGRLQECALDATTKGNRYINSCLR
ncbi:hypothetical protein LIER_11552 [Lithospermum erythrorhizon]|uniref:BLOC-1-related complex subunit 6 C-terminal helix domain-containing protein n=1 Tax=Lithospermum erythrorhizon TaxID=34254 RepID=A0AAV3PQ17_LITER